MEFSMEEAIEVLERLPKSLELFLSGLSDSWLNVNEGEGTWTVNQVIDHLIEGERSNWIPRLEKMLEEGEEKSLPPLDRFAHLYNPIVGITIDEKLQELKALRMGNINKLKQLVDPARHLKLVGIHPALGQVTIGQLIATWAIHDLTHTSQILRVMAKQYTEHVGPWREYLSILK